MDALLHVTVLRRAGQLLVGGRDLALRLRIGFALLYEGVPSGARQLLLLRGCHAGRVRRMGKRRSNREQDQSSELVHGDLQTTRWGYAERILARTTPRPGLPLTIPA